MELGIAAEHHPRIALEPGIDRRRERADPGNRRDAEGEAGEKNAEAAQPPAHLPARQAEGDREGSCLPGWKLANTPHPAFPRKGGGFSPEFSTSGRHLTPRAS